MVKSQEESEKGNKRRNRWNTGFTVTTLLFTFLSLIATVAIPMLGKESSIKVKTSTTTVSKSSSIYNHSDWSFGNSQMREQPQIPMRRNKLP